MSDRVPSGLFTAIHGELRLDVDGSSPLTYTRPEVPFASAISVRVELDGDDAVLHDAMQVHWSRFDDRFSDFPACTGDLDAARSAQDRLHATFAGRGVLESVLESVLEKVRARRDGYRRSS